MNMWKAVLFFFLVTSCAICNAQEPLPFRIMFYNVENLFDTKKDSCKQDDEFLPESIRAWHYGRYKKKLANLSRVITAIGEWNPPAIVGLCEVENDQVLRDLTRHSPLKQHGYRYVMTDSPDARGIDVALLYQRDQFKLLAHRSIPVILDKGRPTRDLLHVTGVVSTLDTLDVFIAHFPSRSEGQKATEPNRLKAAATLRSAVDSLFSCRKAPRIIIMGDLNDYPKNKAISRVLDAKATSGEVVTNKLYHLLAGKADKYGTGSYKYQGEWGLLDHIIVSGLLLDSKCSIYTNPENAFISTLPFLLIRDEKYGGKRPFRTYYGMKYEGGYSDHLPVFFNLLFNQ